VDLRQPLARLFGPQPAGIQLTANARMLVVRLVYGRLQLLATLFVPLKACPRLGKLLFNRADALLRGLDLLA
jgi:hypothetical protein